MTSSWNFIERVAHWKADELFRKLIFNEMDPRRQHGASIWEPVLSIPAPEHSLLECYYACRRQQSCQYEGTGEFGTSPIFVQLSGKPLLASNSLLSVLERKVQWRSKKLPAADLDEWHDSLARSFEVKATKYPVFGWIGRA